MALHNNTTTPATSAGIKPLWGTLILPKTGKTLALHGNSLLSIWLNLFTVDLLILGLRHPGYFRLLKNDHIVPGSHLTLLANCPL